MRAYAHISSSCDRQLDTVRRGGGWGKLVTNYRGPECVAFVFVCLGGIVICRQYRGADKSLARPTSRCILFDGENISLMLVLLYIYIYINSTNIPPIVIINRIYEHQILLSL